VHLVGLYIYGKNINLNNPIIMPFTTSWVVAVE
jgi:hypothetical protein